MKTKRSTKRVSTTVPIEIGSIPTEIEFMHAESALVDIAAEFIEITAHYDFYDKVSIDSFKLMRTALLYAKTLEKRIDQKWHANRQEMLRCVSEIGMANYRIAELAKAFVDTASENTFDEEPCRAAYRALRDSVEMRENVRFELAQKADEKLAAIIRQETRVKKGGGKCK
jgi:hypothetical protein